MAGLTNWAMGLNHQSAADAMAMSDDAAQTNMQITQQSMQASALTSNAKNASTLNDAVLSMVKSGGSSVKSAATGG
jgi:hypothetical protein